MSNPGLTPEWASIILDSHQKNFADECAICFSEIGHDFRTAELHVRAEEFDDVASAGTAESDDFAACARPATYSAHVPDAALDPKLNDDCREHDAALAAPYADARSPGDGGFDIVHGYGTISPADSCGSAGLDAGSAARQPPCASGDDGRADVFADERNGGNAESAVRIDDGRHPDAVAEEIMMQPSNLCTKEQLEFLYRTCRCAAAFCVCRCWCLGEVLSGETIALASSDTPVVLLLHKQAAQYGMNVNRALPRCAMRLHVEPQCWHLVCITGSHVCQQQSHNFNITCTFIRWLVLM